MFICWGEEAVVPEYTEITIIRFVWLRGERKSLNNSINGMFDGKDCPVGQFSPVHNDAKKNSLTCAYLSRVVHTDMKIMLKLKEMSEKFIHILGLYESAS